MKRVLAAVAAFLFAALMAITPQQSAAQYVVADTTTVMPTLNFADTGHQGAGVVRRDTSRTIYIEGASNIRYSFMADSAVSCSLFSVQVSMNDTLWATLSNTTSSTGLVVMDNVTGGTWTVANRFAHVFPAVPGDLNVGPTLPFITLPFPIPWRFARFIITWKTVMSYYHAEWAYASIYKPYTR